MGVTHALGVRAARTARFVRPLAWATLVANCVLVVTGGAVRLTGSGLGCPTWPRCTAESYTPHGALDLHAAIEFGNRMLTFVLVAIAIATFVAAAATLRRELLWLATALALGIPAQAVIGGVTVLTDLNPWVVSFHLLCSLAIIGLSVVFLHRIDHPEPAVARGPALTLAWLVLASAWAVLYVGTVVTGSGPHAGDEDSRRNGLDPLQVSQLHADAVFLFVGLTVGLLFLLLATRAPRPAVRACVTLLAVELAQGAVGFVQYFTDLPVLLVGVHMLGAAVISASVTWVVLQVRHPARSERQHPERLEAPRDSAPLDAPEVRVTSLAAPRTGHQVTGRPLER